MKALDKPQRTVDQQNRSDSEKEWGMRIAVLATLTISISAVIPVSSALEPIVCTVYGSTTYGGSMCSSGPVRSYWTELDFSVSGLCKDCDGTQWTPGPSPLYTVTGDCPHDCGAFLFTEGTRQQVSDNLVRYVATGIGREWRTDKCVAVSSHDAYINCTCSSCGQSSPILISTTDGRYELTSAANGVYFDLDADGTAELTAWTAAGSDEAFLALDRNQNGQIDGFRELFGDNSPQFPSDEPNGWRALAIWDDSLNGGNEDGRIDAGDYIFSSLQLWIDENHNGFSESSELFHLEELGVVYLDLNYKKAERKDRFGNTFRYSSKVGTNGNGVNIAWNVFFVKK